MSLILRHYFVANTFRFINLSSRTFSNPCSAAASHSETLTTRCRGLWMSVYTTVCSKSSLTIPHWQTICQFHCFIDVWLRKSNGDEASRCHIHDIIHDGSPFGVMGGGGGVGVIRNRQVCISENTSMNRFDYRSATNPRSTDTQIKDILDSEIAGFGRLYCTGSAMLYWSTYYYHTSSPIGRMHE